MALVFPLFLCVSAANGEGEGLYSHPSVEPLRYHVVWDLVSRGYVPLAYEASSTAKQLSR